MKENKILKTLKEILPYIIIIAAVIIFKQFFYAPIRVNGKSMNNTLKDGDIMVLNIVGLRQSKIKRFDIVVIDSGSDYIIKRVIGLPGEEIEYKDNELYINGKKTKDKYGNGKTNDFKIKVGDNKYFAMGDNRNDSLDSRYFGAFKKNKILGKTNFTIFPFNRFGKKQ